MYQTKPKYGTDSRWKPLVLLLGLTLLLQDAGAQATATDSLPGLSYSSAVRTYRKALSGQERLYVGVEHKGYGSDITGHAYFNAPRWQTGSVYYEGILFENVPLLYDQVKDVVIVLHPSTSLRVELMTDKVGYFALPGHFFVYLDEGGEQRPPMGRGLYERIGSGSVQILARKRKFLEQRVEGMGLHREFLLQQYYFLVGPGGYRPIQNEQDLLAAFGERRREVRQYLRKNRLRFRKDREQTVNRALAYFDSLKK